MKPNRVRSLILTPTRELASQIDSTIKTYQGKLNIFTTVIFGGVGQSQQVRKLSKGIDILIATPGRLLDLMNQGHVKYDQLEIFVLDEADRMLDMGFIHDIKKIIKKLPVKRQTLMFSATMPINISKLANSILKNPVRVEVTPQATTVDKIKQRVNLIEKSKKLILLKNLLDDKSLECVLVFTKTKHGANKVVKYLDHFSISSAAIHGNKSQTARERALGNFRSGEIRVLVATDIAARGIDVPQISHVINYDLPNVPESYVHRIGRTARAGRGGIAIAFCDPSEVKLLKDIERLIKFKVPVAKTLDFQKSIKPKPACSTLKKNKISKRPNRQKRYYTNSEK